MAKKTENHTPMTQRSETLAFAGGGTPINAQGTAPALKAPSTNLQLAASNGLASAKQVSQTPPATTCKQCLTLNFYFDGTGNNIDADVGTNQHSNVARLFQSRLRDNDELGRYSFYIYGLGTYFAEVGDPGNTDAGKGFGAWGEERMTWVFKKFDEALKKAVARAQNPTNKIRFIKLNVFGFSRGATMARAFVRDMQKRCKSTGDDYTLKVGGHPIEVSFLGLFDTVASVGLPMAANSTPILKVAKAYSMNYVLKLRANEQGQDNNINPIAFGAPGADPAPGMYDGHADWADGLEVTSFVKQCVHMVAGHEIRNSFPVDSTLHGRRYPSQCREMLYPGAHSDVGGGYQPGEGARSDQPGELLSLIPLRAMHNAALIAGVPLMSVTTIKGDSRIAKFFALDDDGAKQYAAMQTLYQHYMAAAGSGGRDIGSEMLAHSAYHLRWKFMNIHRNMKAKTAGKTGPDATAINRNEPKFAKERAELQKRVDALDKTAKEAESVAAKAHERYLSAQRYQANAGVPIPSSVTKDASDTKEAADQKRDAHLSEKAKLDTYANDSELIKNLGMYEARLIEDAKTIMAYQKQNPKLKLRPHYQNLMDAYKDEFIDSKGLQDEKIIAFFDYHVHDSLAGFATDATLPSDPRVIYIGGDNKMKYAKVDDSQNSPQVQTA